jgi:hypothetical protein
MEPSLGIIAGCAATLRPLAKLFGLGLGSSRRYYGAASKLRHNHRHHHPLSVVVGSGVLNGVVGGTGTGVGGWRLQRGMQKLEDDGVMAVVKGHLRHSEGANSDIELVKIDASGRALGAASSSASSWDMDVENDAATAGALAVTTASPITATATGNMKPTWPIGASSPPLRPPVHVETSIEIVTTARVDGDIGGPVIGAERDHNGAPGPDSDDEAGPGSPPITFPMQGERMVTINGPDGEGGLFQLRTVQR